MAERSRAWTRVTMLAVAGLFTATGMALGRRKPGMQLAGTGGETHDIERGATEVGSGETGRGRRSHSPSRKARQDGFEPKDISAAGAAKIIAGWMCAVLLVIVGLSTLRGMYARTDRANAPPVTAQTGAPVIPPGPRLQADPPHDLASLRDYEAQVLGNYAALPGDPAHVRIPITEAMQRVIGRSLDPPPNATAQPGANP